MLELLYGITDGNLFQKYCETFSHVLLSCKMLLKLMSFIPWFVNISFRKLRISLQFKSFLTGRNNLNLYISKFIDIILALGENLPPISPKSIASL